VNDDRLYDELAPRPPEDDGAVVDFEVPTDFGPLPPPVAGPASQTAAATVEVRRRAWLAGTVTVAAGAVGAAYATRAWHHSGGAGTWALAGLMGLVALAYLAVLVDSRAPLLVADDQGVRLRLGRSWAGLRWGSLRVVEVTPRNGLRDGRLVLEPRNPTRVEDELGRGGRRAVALNSRLHGAPFVVPLSLATRLTGAGDDLVDTLRALAGEQSGVVRDPGWRPDPDGVVEVGRLDGATERASVGSADPEPGPAPSSWDHPDGVLVGGAHRGAMVDASVLVGATAGDDGTGSGGKHRWHDPRPVQAHGISQLAGRLRPGSGEVADVTPPVVASSTPSPLREPAVGVRSDVRVDSRVDSRIDLVSGANALALDDDDLDTRTRALPEAFVLRRPGAVDLGEEQWDAYGEHVRPVLVPGEALETVVVEDFAIAPADEPVIGPEFAAARERLGLSVDQLAERTRIRPHVIESIESDDFEPCGGDFYARGHIRTLARVLGVDAAPLLVSYDERYADAPIDPRRVFEAELAHSGGIRATRGGPNWSVLVAAVMALVLAWSIARLVMDGPVALRDQPVLNGSGGPNHKGVAAAPAVPVVISAPGGGARVIVRDGAGSVVFNGDLAFGATRTLSVSPPVRIQSTDGSVTVSVDGQTHGAIGDTGSPASGTYVAH
jgi:hypothetical protein